MSQSTLSQSPYFNSNLFSGYYLDERIDDLDDWDCDEEAQAAFDELLERWEHEFDLVQSYNEDELLDSWIDEVIDVLGFGTLSETTLPGSDGYNDRLLFQDDESRREGARRKADGEVEAMYGKASAILEAKQWNADFGKRFSEHRSYRDASHQIKYYLEHTPDSMEWGILTDGRKWRLYGTKDYATETYYEIDLAELLNSGSLERFKYFYVFFRPEAFREVAGTTFLDTVWSESETAAQELGEDLQDNVFTALRILGEGFVETNSLDIDPDDEDGREQLKEQSLVLLYRLMFVLYAESRNLIHPEDSDAQDEYLANFSLDELRLEIHHEIESGDSFDDFSEHSTSMWSRLEDLFRLVDNGEEALGIPPYNGGLFDDDRHDFLASHAVADRYIAEVIYRLGTTETDDGSFVLADYADLDTRHLGSIYEGLLEHEFRIAPEQYAAVSEDGSQVWKPASDVTVAEAVETVERGELYVVNDDGERKATGAYYTPDYVVAYIVEETIDPLLEDIKAGLEADGLEPSEREFFARFWQEVLDLKILDPAMGSGHFLTKATGYLTEQVMEVVREQEIQSYDEQDLRREIAKECIYGVDLNGMAVELAKLSMWLETLAADQPLAFLDHHLKTGNSLVGSDITDVLSNGNGDGDDGQITIFQAAARVQQQTLQHVMDLMQDLLAIDNETLADIKSMEEIYDEIRADPLYQRLFALANVHTAERFGVDVPEGAYEEMAKTIEDEDDWVEIEKEDWFAAAQTTAEEVIFFHWELEYPEVFFGEGGEKRGDAGFDAVIGNPPYVKIQNIRRTNAQLAEYASSQFQSATGRFDLYGLFVERGSKLAREDRLGYILPNKFFESQAGVGLRTFLQSDSLIDRILDFGQQQVFAGATTYTCLLFLGGDEKFRYGEVQNISDGDRDLYSVNFTETPIEELDSDGWILTGAMERQALNKMRSNGVSLESLTESISEGIVSGDNGIMFVNLLDSFEDEYLIQNDIDEREYLVEAAIVRPLTDGDNLARYRSINPDEGVVFAYHSTNGNTIEIPESELKVNYPKIYSYLSDYAERLESRGSESMEYPTWYSLWCPRNKDIFESSKILVPDVCERSEFTVDFDGGTYVKDTGYAIKPKNDGRDHLIALTAILNSSPVWFYIYHTSPVLRGDFRRFKTSYLEPIPVPDYDDEEVTLADGETPFREIHQKGLNQELPSIPEGKTKFLTYLSNKMFEFHERVSRLNSNLLDHLGTYSDGPILSDIGFTQPPKGAADSILQETTEQKPNLRVGEAIVVRESPNTVEVRLSARYKPDPDQKGSSAYTETDPLPALRITDLTETEADLIEAFVPVAVDEAGGFANFRETATKTNSLVDRLRKLTLPAVDDVREGLASYRETKERADELEEKIERTDELIDEIVYELYGLTDEEIEIVESSVRTE